MILLRRLCLAALLGLFVTGSHGWAEETACFCPRTLDAGVYYGPAPATEADVVLLQRLGIREIIDLRLLRRRASHREARWAQRAGLTYTLMPTGFTPDYPDCSLETVLRKMRQRRCGPIYVHCSLGRDRAGLIVGLYRVRHLGWTPQQAYCEMERLQYNSRLVGLDRYFWCSVARQHGLTRQSERR
jgi:protein tyrosine phosphatase (PTP) superfamily phosphohydrolase (DUF442 family)